MKKTIAILLVAVLAAGSVFAGFSGSADLTAGFYIDAKKYDFIENGTELKVAFDVTTGEDAASGEGVNIPVAGYRQSGEMETVVPAIWEPLPRKGMFRLRSSGPSQIILSGFYQARTPPA